MMYKNTQFIERERERERQTDRDRETETERQIIAKAKFCGDLRHTVN